MYDYRRLEAWQLSHATTLAIYSVTKAFPEHERFGLSAQLRRSTASIGYNLAEGAGRGSQSDFARFVDIAGGSANEIEYQLLLVLDLGYLDNPTHRHLTDEVRRLRAMLVKLAAALRTP